MQFAQALKDLLRWIDNTDTALRFSTPIAFFPQDVQNINYSISVICGTIADEYPYYAERLPGIGNNLFRKNAMGVITLNTAAFGQLFTILKHIDAEPMNTQVWKNIHPRVVNVSKALYCNRHFDSAAEKAIKEVETRLREKFAELKPNATAPAGVNTIVGALLGDGNVFSFCDTSTISGKNYRKGVHQLFEGMIAAYRNPAAHANISCTKREALEQIMLSSQLMYILDLPQLNKE